MGVDLKPILIKETIKMNELKNRVITVDAPNILHQFLSTIRQPDGTLLTDSEGHVTSHLVGLFYRTLRLIRDYSIKPVYVFDGKMPDIKSSVIEERLQKKMEATEKWKKVKAKGETDKAFREAQRSSILSTQMIQDSKKLLDLLGLPTVQAPSEAEAQCAFMTKNDEVFAMNSRDYDSLLFGSKKLLRHLTISNKENVEIIILRKFLEHHKITHEQLVDIGILIGTDYNEGIFGVGPKTSLKLIKEHKKIEKIPRKYLDKLEDNFNEIRKLFLDPPITTSYKLEFSEPNKPELLKFLCGQRGFPKERVIDNLEK